MINGAHAIIYSTDAEADRAFLRDVIGLPHVDAGDGWLIFALPPAEVAVHSADESADESDRHELYFTCPDVEALCESLALGNVDCTPIQDQGWGLVTRVRLPGGGELPIYQPRHPRPEWAPSAAAGKRRSSAKSKPSSQRTPKAAPAKRTSPPARAKRAAKSTKPTKSPTKPTKKKAAAQAKKRTRR